MILGIDPGKTGAAAVYDPDLDMLVTYQLPTIWRIVNKKKRFFVDFRTFKVWLMDVQPMVNQVILEEPTSMPGQGKVSAFSFGKTCGAIEGLLLGLGFEHVLMVHPAKWKNALDVPSDKNQARRRAVQLLPTHAEQFKDRADEAKAEASLLAYYGSVTENPAPRPMTAVHMSGKSKATGAKRGRKKK